MSIDNFEPRVIQLVIYPVKGLAGQPCETVEVLDRGFAWDHGERSSEDQTEGIPLAATTINDIADQAEKLRVDASTLFV
jgi:hypothetical protein